MLSSCIGGEHLTGTEKRNIVLIYSVKVYLGLSFMQTAHEIAGDEQTTSVFLEVAVLRCRHHFTSIHDFLKVFARPVQESGFCTTVDPWMSYKSQSAYASANTEDNVALKNLDRSSAHKKRQVCRKLGAAV